MPPLPSVMKDQRLYVRARGAESRNFLEIKVVESGSDDMTIIVPDRQLAKRNHLELFHHNVNGDFVRELFQVVKFKKSRKGILIQLSRINWKKAAETREHKRITTDTIRARFCDEDDCKVLDISRNGFSILTSERVEIGDSVSVVLHYNCTAHAGTAKVMSVRQSGPELVRYGMCCETEVFETPDDLTAALPRITMELELLGAHPVKD